MSRLNRRDFLKVVGTGTLGLSTMSVLSPRYFLSMAQAQSASPSVSFFLHVYQSGGADNFFGVGAYGDDIRAVRQNLYHEPNGNTAVGFTSAAGRDLHMHSSLASNFFLDAWNRGELSVLFGAGIPTRNSRSHEEATKDVITGVADGTSEETVPFEQRLAGLNLSRFSDSLKFVDLTGGSFVKPAASYEPMSGSLDSFGFSSNLATAENKFRLGTFWAANRPEGLSARQTDVYNSFETVESTSSVVNQAIAATSISPAFPNTNIGTQMRQAFIAFTALGTNIASVSIGGHDTHTDESAGLGSVYTQLGAALQAFYLNMVRVGAWGRCAVVVNTEFGRNIRMNNGRGTDHGDGNVNFLAGGAIKGGVLGAEILTTETINAARNAWPIVIPIAGYYKAIAQNMGLDVRNAFPDYQGPALDVIRT